MLKIYSKKNVFIVLFLLLANFYLIQNASAGVAKDLEDQLKGAGKSSWGESVPTGENSLPGIIATVITAFLGLLGIIFLVLIIYAGFEWMTAQGDEEKVTKAKDTLQRAIIGLIIITAAYSITYFVFNSLSNSGGSNPLNITTG